MEQTYIAMKEQGFQNIGKMGAAQRNLGSQHLVAMSQSFVNLPLDKWSEYFDIIIVDEADVGVSADSRNYKILTQLLAPVRIGVSATLPENEINRLYLEGLLGPVIEEMKIQDGVKLDLLAKPKLRLISVPENSTNQDLTRYSDIYDAKIVNSRTRNRLVINAALEYVDEGKTVLILVTKVEHGKNLSSMGKLIGQDIPFIWGDVDSQERMRLKAGLDKREIKIIVANNVWKRGINVPSLDVLINAAGEKSSSATEQRKGRGLRKFEGKEAAILVDFLDKGKYLADHCIHRLSLYADQGLL
uniref:Putative helicase n=1 Tax=viral metagenome TaxID=1070528 RepID=A0A6M3ILV0_9ZZZZ